MPNNDYEQILQSKMDEIEQARIKREAEYEEEQRLLKEKYEADITKLQEAKNKVLELQTVNFEDLDSIEKATVIINDTEFSDEELETIWQVLATASTHNLINSIEQPTSKEEAESPVTEKPIIETETTTPKEYNNIRIIKKRYEESDEEKIDLTEWNNLSTNEKKEKVKVLFDTASKQYAKRVTDEEEFNYNFKTADMYMKAIQDGIIKNDPNFSKVMSDYNQSYNTMLAEYHYLAYHKQLDKKIDINDDTYERLINLQRAIDKCRKAFNEIAKMHKKIMKKEQSKQEDSLDLEPSIKNIVEEQSEEETHRQKVISIVTNPEILEESVEEEFEVEESIKELLDKYNTIKDNPQYANNSSLKSIESSMNVFKQYLDMSKEEKESWKEYINDAVDGVIASLDEDIESVFFPKANNEYSNIGSQNIILFLENEEGICTIEDDLDDLDAGEQKQIASELKYSLESKYKENSWIRNLKSKSDHLKGSKVRIGKQDSEIWNCKCGTKKTRMSLWPITLNAEIKQKLKEEYNLPDTFESILLICDIAPSHRIDYLQSKANKNSEGISRVNDLFSNPDVSFEQIKEIIKNSSVAYDRISTRAKEMK